MTAQTRDGITLERHRSACHSAFDGALLHAQAEPEELPSQVELRLPLGELGLFFGPGELLTVFSLRGGMFGWEDCCVPVGFKPAPMPDTSSSTSSSPSPSQRHRFLASINTCLCVLGGCDGGAALMASR